MCLIHSVGCLGAERDGVDGVKTRVIVIVVAGKEFHLFLVCFLFSYFCMNWRLGEWGFLYCFFFFFLFLLSFFCSQKIESLGRRRW